MGVFGSSTIHKMDKMESPLQQLEKIRARWAPSANLDSPQFAALLDEQDPLARFREKFEFPTLGSLPCQTEGPPNSPVVYMCGNSLGLKPKQADEYMREQLESWGQRAVFMHFTGRIPAALVGADSPKEVTIMNGLTVNLHLLMMAFYKPEGMRRKTLIEDHAFPSDRYAVRSLLRVKGVDEDCLILVRPRPGEDTIRTEDIRETIRRENHSLALVMLSGVQYYTGQKFEMDVITREGQAAGAKVGWDLAHAVGNVPLHLNKWGVDFAVWCSYKYLNSGAGGIAGAFVHSRHHEAMPSHLQGWWSNAQETRFEMRDHVDPAPGAARLPAQPCVQLRPQPGAQQNREARSGVRCATSQRHENRARPPLQFLQRRPRLCHHSTRGFTFLCSIVLSNNMN